MATQYDWRTSREAFRVFKIVLDKTLNEGKYTTVAELSKELDKHKSVISRQIGVFENKGLLDSFVDGKNKFFLIDIKKLKKTLGVKSRFIIKSASMVSLNFDEFELKAKNYSKTDLTKVFKALEKEHLVKKWEQEKTSDILLRQYFLAEERIEKLKKENQELKKKLNN